jgi:hypothetical protein
VAQYGRVSSMEAHDEKAEYPWDCRWSGVIECDALVASTVSRRECGTIS